MRGGSISKFYIDVSVNFVVDATSAEAATVLWPLACAAATQDTLSDSFLLWIAQQSLGAQLCKSSYHHYSLFVRSKMQTRMLLDLIARIID